MPILTTIPFEKYLIRTENTADTINRHTTMLENMQIVIPKLILNEESHDWTYGTQKTARIRNRIKRQITNNVCSFIILTHFIA